MLLQHARYGALRRHPSFCLNEGEEFVFKTAFEMGGVRREGKYAIPFFFGGTSLLIVVGVALDTMGQLEAHLIMRHYQGFGGSGKGRIRGRWFNIGG